MNIKDLTFSQLQKLKMNPVLHGKETYDFDEDESQPHNQPFASFRTVLESVNPECGFNVEIKYPQKKIVRFPGSALEIDFDVPITLFVYFRMATGKPKSRMI